MEDFLGTWKFVKSVNYDEYLKAIGVVQDLDNEVTTEILSEDEDHVVWERVTTHNTSEVRFTLDKEFQVNARDGSQCLITISLKGDQLVQVQKMGKLEFTIIREVQGTNLIMTLKCDGVEAQHIYEKVVVPSSSNATTKRSRNTKPVVDCSIQ